jgi:hypothetical protein
VVVVGGGRRHVDGGGGGGRMMNDVHWQSVVTRLCALSYTAVGMVCRVL